VDGISKQQWLIKLLIIGLQHALPHSCKILKRWVSIFYCLFYGFIWVELFQVTHLISITQVICIPVDAGFAPESHTGPDALCLCTLIDSVWLCLFSP